MDIPKSIPKSTPNSEVLFEAYLETGMRQSQIHFAALNYFSLPEELQPLFPNYFIQHWATKSFLSSLKYGAISFAGKEYIVVYRRGASRAKILKREQVSLSFRQPLPQFGIAAYVLVS